MKFLRYILLLAAAVTLSMPVEASIFSKRKVQEHRVVYDTVRIMHHDTVRIVETVKRTPRPGTLSLNHTPSEIDSLVGEWQKTLLEIGEDRIFGHISESTEGELAMPVDSLYKSRLQDLISPVALPYNYIVRKYIDQYIGTRWSPLPKVVALSRCFYPMIEEEMLKVGIPVELRALAIIESNLSPTAVSRAGAAGMWQLMPSTAKNLGLEVNSLVDERLDPVKSTTVACRFLNSLYHMFGDWTLALAAYNCGPGNVSKAIARAGASCRTYWDIYEFLPKETRGYVPKFIAAIYAYHYYKLHGIEESTLPEHVSTDTVMVDRTLHLGQVASTLGMPIETLQALNPQYRIDVIPASRKQYPLTLPTEYVSEFICRQDSIYAKDSLYLKEFMNPANLDKKREESVGYIYKVRSGDNLSTIARRNHTTVAAIMKWNHLKSSNIRIGQRLRIEKPKPGR